MMKMNHRKLVALSRFGTGRFLCSSSAEQKQAAAPPPAHPNTQHCAGRYVVPSYRPELDFDFLLDDANAAFIEHNAQRRKGIGDVRRVRSLWQRIQRFPPFGSPFAASDATNEAAPTETAFPSPQAPLDANDGTTATTAAADQLRLLWDQFYAEAALLPNITDPGAPVGDASAARCVTEFGPSSQQQQSPSSSSAQTVATAADDHHHHHHQKQVPPDTSASASGEAVVPVDGGISAKMDLYPAEQMVSGWRTLRFPRLGSGRQSYALFGPLCDIERTLLDYAFDFLYEQLQNVEKGVANVELVDVDDILPFSTTRACGVQQGHAIPPSSLQYRVFRANQLRFDDDLSTAPTNLYDDDALVADDAAAPPRRSPVPLHSSSFNGFCLSGTAEMGIAHRLRGRLFEEHELPTYFMAQSRCFRQEVPSNHQDSGLYRVHEFNKIELFVVCTERQSGAELDRIVRLQQSLFASLQLRCRIMDMPSEELGAPAARKFDLEAWMPGRNSWGELCSASNCTDYQARRLHLKYRTSVGNGTDENGQQHHGRPASLRFVHTCNGTGLASTRALIALLETHQTGRQKGVKLPQVITERMPAERSAGIWCKQIKNNRLSFDD